MCQTRLCGKFFQVLGQAQDIGLFKIPFVRHPVAAFKSLNRVLRKRLRQSSLNLVGRPNVVSTFLTFTVSIDRAQKSAFRVPHLIKKKIAGLADDDLIMFTPQIEPHVQVDVQKQGIVVEHFFKVRDTPFRVDAVSGKTAS